MTKSPPDEHPRDEEPSPSVRADSALPLLVAVRPRATDENGNGSVELRFSNGAKIRYRRSGTRIREEWFSPSDTEPTRAHTVETPPVPDGEDVSDKNHPTIGQLSDRALCAIGSYLSFGSRRQAAFTWGEENVAVLAGDVTSD